jgi:hypothetical protein
VRPSRFSRQIAVTALAGCLGACADTPAASQGPTHANQGSTEAKQGAAVPPTAARCDTRIIVTLNQALDGAPNDAFVTDLAHAAKADLTFLRIAGPNLYVFSLTAAEADPSCRNALERLRQDPRIRSVDVDERRKAQG